MGSVIVQESADSLFGVLNLYDAVTPSMWVIYWDWHKQQVPWTFCVRRLALQFDFQSRPYASLNGVAIF